LACVNAQQHILTPEPGSLKIALIVNPILPVPPLNYGGIERIVYMLAAELKKKGHEVVLFANELSEPGVELRPYRENSTYGFGDFFSTNLLTAKIAIQKFDIVHTFGRMSNISLLMFSKIPKIVSYQLHPTVSQVKKAVKLARKNTLYFTACSNFIANQISPFCDVTTIYNGIDLSEYKFTDDADQQAPLVFLGRIQEIKGTGLAIQVARESGRKIIIAGNIPEDEIHQRYYREMVAPFIENDQVRYIGPVNNFQKNELLGSASALLMPVTWDEPFGIVMAEALACGTPVVGFKRGALPEIIEDGVNGYLADSVTEMVDCIGKLPLIKRGNCRATAEKKFNSLLLAGQYEALYYRVTGKV